MASFHVPLKKVVDDSYDIEIGRSLVPSLIQDLKNGIFPKANKLAIITDSNVEAIYIADLMTELKDAGFNAFLFSFPAGEASKTRETKISIEDKMLDAGFGRDSAVIAFGGGVVSDLAGFTDYDAGAVVDKKMGSNLRAGVDIDPRAGVRPLRHHPREEWDASREQDVRKPLHRDGFDARISEDDLLKAFGGRVPFVSSFDIGPHKPPHLRQTVQ